MSYSVHTRAETARYDRLQGLIYGIIGATDIIDDNALLVSEAALPESRLNQATNGLYAEIIGNGGELLWQSKSVTEVVPDIEYSPIGEWIFENFESQNGVAVHRLQLATAWELDNGEELAFIVHAVADGDILTADLRRFDRTLWITLLGSALALLLLQLVILHISLQPLRHIGNEVTEIEQGHRTRLSEQVPTEIKPLAGSINALLVSEKNRHQQYRHLLDDLAHSLKTPLSVLNNIGNDRKQSATSDASETIAEQTAQMQSTVDHYLRRAAMRTPQYLATASSPLPAIRRINDSLTKIYADPAITFTVNVDADFKVRVADVDLFEILGNVLENACKYGATAINISTDPNSKALIIKDNGPGFPATILPQLAQRGVRADTAVEGQGLGLAASQELMQSYGGELELANGEKQGAIVTLQFT